MLPIPGVLNLQPGLHVFVIKNEGAGDLILTGPPVLILAGLDADQFAVEQQPALTTLTTGQSTTFTIRYEPDELGTHDAIVRIVNNDDLTGGFFDFAVQGQGVRIAASVVITAHDGSAVVGAASQIGTASVVISASDGEGLVSPVAEQVDTASVIITAHDGSVPITPFRPYWNSGAATILID